MRCDRDVLGHDSGVCVRVGGVGQDRRAVEQAKMRQGFVHCAGVWTSGGEGGWGEGISGTDYRRNREEKLEAEYRQG
jgi:hypothetical protein